MKTKAFLLVLTLLAVGCGKKDVEDCDTVFICTGRYSRCFHASENCEGLDNCGGVIREIRRADVQKFRRPCGYCFKRRVERLGEE